MLTKKDYCDYDTCVALEELGYPLTSKEVRYEDKAVFVPGVLLYSAQKWLREVKHIDVLVYLDDMKGYFPFIRIWEGTWNTFVSLEESHTNNIEYSKNYESSLLEGIKEAVKILKDETND